MIAQWIRLKSLLARPIDAASLAFVRMAFGTIMALEAISLLRPSASTNGVVMVETFYTGPEIKLHFPYAWFEWLPVLSSAGIYAVVALLGVSGITLAFGLLYRLSAVLVFLSWGYLYAIESTRTYWMSYYYLELLVAFLLIWMPAARVLSLDAVIFKRRQIASTVPFWSIFLLRGQLVITYFYAGLAKVNADWLLDAVPVRDFLAKSPFLARFGPLLSSRDFNSAKKILESDSLAYFLSYAGTIFDLSVGALLLVRRTRMLGLVLLVGFHLTNLLILFDNLVWFPLLGILTATIFLDPDWPRQLVRKIRGSDKSRPGQPKIQAPLQDKALSVRPLVASFVVAWLAVQAIVPLRQYLIPGDARFTWEGLSFSWRLKSEWYRTIPFEISVSDPAIISDDSQGTAVIHWDQWHGRKAIYRQVVPEKLNWSLLPVIVVLFEPKLGERIIYNPLSGATPVQTESEARAQIEGVWRERYGRAPASVHPMVPYLRLAQACASVFRNHGEPVPTNPEDAIALYVQRFGVNGSGEGMPALRRAQPFILEHNMPFSAPFMVIEDSALLQESRPHFLTVNADAWKMPSKTGARAESHDDALVVYSAPLQFAPEIRKLLPTFCILESPGSAKSAPEISYDILAELSPSQAMHVSTNPFLLRRYAREVAALWEKEYHRRPAIHATTGVSLNRRPLQPLVDPFADLASVPVTHFGHNPWIEDLKLARIPRENLVGGTPPIQ